MTGGDVYRPSFHPRPLRYRPLCPPRPTPPATNRALVLPPARCSPPTDTRTAPAAGSYVPTSSAGPAGPAMLPTDAGANSASGPRRLPRARRVAGRHPSYRRPVLLHVARSHRRPPVDHCRGLGEQGFQNSPSGPSRRATIMRWRRPGWPCRLRAPPEPCPDQAAPQPRPVAYQVHRREARLYSPRPGSRTPRAARS